MTPDFSATGATQHLPAATPRHRSHHAGPVRLSADGPQLFAAGEHGGCAAGTFPAEQFADPHVGRCSCRARAGEAGDRLAEQIDRIYWLALSRPPTAEEKNIISAELAEAYEAASSQPDRKKRLMARLCHAMINSTAFHLRGLRWPMKQIQTVNAVRRSRTRPRPSRRDFFHLVSDGIYGAALDFSAL